MDGRRSGLGMHRVLGRRTKSDLAGAVLSAWLGLLLACGPTPEAGDGEYIELQDPEQGGDPERPGLTVPVGSSAPAATTPTAGSGNLPSAPIQQPPPALSPLLPEASGTGSAPATAGAEPLPARDLVNAGWVGAPCQDNSSCRYELAYCLREQEGYPQGTCSRACTSVCPAAVDTKYVGTACIDGGEISSHDSGLCLARCDTGVYPGSGCRSGYRCAQRRQSGSAVTRIGVCLPDTLAEDEEVVGDWHTLGVEAWRPLVEQYFKPEDVAWAMRVMKCESGGNPNAKNSSSGASGLFQHMPQYWDGRASKAGFPGASIFDPEANIAASAYLFYHGGPGHWSCKFLINNNGVWSCEQQLDEDAEFGSP